MSRKKKLREFSFLCSIVFSSFWWRIVQGISCHECGIMYDGTNLMGVKAFDECQFFESDIAQREESFLRECPEDDRCCFSLREYMYIDFWGHSAAAEVFLHGCCSALNTTKHHHLQTTIPPPLATSKQFRAEILSQTMQDDHMQTRVMFCNTPGCNSKRIPWSQPINLNTMTPAPNLNPQASPPSSTPGPEPTPEVTPQTSTQPSIDINGIEYEYEYYEEYEEEPLPPEMSDRMMSMSSEETAPNESVRSQSGEKIDTMQTNDQEFNLDIEPTEDLNVIDLLFVEEGRSPNPVNGGRKVPNVQPPPDLPEEGFNTSSNPPDDDVIQANQSSIREIEPLADLSAGSNPKTTICECNCNCPALVCPSRLQVPPNSPARGHASYSVPAPGLTWSTLLVMFVLPRVQ